MPRKPLIYTDEHPYHVVARSNNKDWFYIPKPETWFIFKQCLNEAQKRFNFKIYLFVLMDNHYHLIAQCSDKSNLGEVMGWLQKTVSKNINSRAGKINHVFGGTYKGCLIQHPHHFAAVYKYVARNPVEAGLCSNVESYPFLTLNNHAIKVEASNEWFASIPSNRKDTLSWLNNQFDPDERFQIKAALQKTVFQETQVKRVKRQLEFPLIK